MTATKYSSASRYSTKDSYRWFKKQNPETTITYSLYKHIITRFNKRACEMILEGQLFNMGQRLGSIRIKKIPRTFNKPTIDWGETNRLKKQGIKKLVYYTDDYYYRWNWDKHRCLVKNKSVYTFAPTAGQSGNRRKLVQKLKTDEFAHLNYKT